MKASFSIAAHRGGILAKGLQVVAGCIALCVAPAAFLPASGQSDAQYAPPREGNVYDHRAHQPTEAQLCRKGAAPSINCPSAATRRLIEDEVQQLLRDTDIDSGLARRQLDHPKR